MLKKILIRIGVVSILGLIGILFFLKWFDDVESFEVNLGATLGRTTAQEVYKYKIEHDKLPESLAEAGIKDTLCDWSYGCAHIKYSTGPDGKGIYLAAARNGNSWVGWFSSNLQPKWIKDGRVFGGFGIAHQEGYTGADKSWPIYRETLPTFETPSAWPKF